MMLLALILSSIVPSEPLPPTHGALPLSSLLWNGRYYDTLGAIGAVLPAVMMLKAV
ncbi:MAG: hypothetical protein R2865_15555 [Deinococcales bacterium]